MSKRIDAAGGSTPEYMEVFLNSRSVVEQTRWEWFERPEELLPAEARIAVGIGFAALTRGGWVIYEEEDGSRPMTVADAEKLALRAPEHEWCIHLVGTGQERHYKRVGAGLWKLYRWGAGLAGPGRRSTPGPRISSGAAA